MSATKIVTILDNDIVLVAGAGNHTSNIWTINDGYGGELCIKFTNGATGPTVPAQTQIEGSPDNIHWYEFAGVISGNNEDAGIKSCIIGIPIGFKYARLISGSNIDENVTIRVEGIEVAEIGQDSTAMFSETFDNTDLVGNVLTKSHNLERLPASVLISDADNKIVIVPTEISTTQIIVDFGGAITGTWNISAI